MPLSASQRRTPFDSRMGLLLAGKALNASITALAIVFAIVIDAMILVEIRMLVVVLMCFAYRIRLYLSRELL